jgi:hypothetical protein
MGGDEGDFAEEGRGEQAGQVLAEGEQFLTQILWRQERRGDKTVRGGDDTAYIRGRGRGKHREGQVLAQGLGDRGGKGREGGVRRVHIEQEEGRRKEGSGE